MKIYLAGDCYIKTCVEKYNTDETLNKPYRLETFFEATHQKAKMIHLYGDYMLDSGAFSMFNGKKKGDLKAYIDRYIEYINCYDVKKFFELDIDPIVGYDEVLKIRKYIEKGTGKKPIPVWHKSRGKDNFVEMCKEYPYVAIGGIVSREISKKEWKYLPWFIDIAHENGAKIHGLGFTALTYLPKFHFDSVDSSAWISGNRAGFLYKFNGETIIKIKRPDGMQLKPKEGALNNYAEWRKFSRYAEMHF